MKFVKRVLITMALLILAITFISKFLNQELLIVQALIMLVFTAAVAVIAAPINK